MNFIYSPGIVLVAGLFLFGCLGSEKIETSSPKDLNSTIAWYELQSNLDTMVSPEIDFVAIGNDGTWGIQMAFDSILILQTKFDTTKFEDFLEVQEQSGYERSYSATNQNQRIDVFLSFDSCRNQWPYKVYLKAGTHPNIIDSMGCGIYNNGIWMHNIWGLVGSRSIKVPKSLIFELNLRQNRAYITASNWVTEVRIEPMGSKIQFGHIPEPESMEAKHLVHFLSNKMVAIRRVQNRMVLSSEDGDLEFRAID